MTRAVLSIGSNLGDRLGYLRDAVAGFGTRVIAVSPVYATAPWGGVDQDDFLNITVLAEDSAFECLDWLRRGQELEQAAQRTRPVRWGPRTLDVDVIWCGTESTAVRSADPELTLPHPRAHQRAFVLIPWLAVQPDATLEVDGTSHPIAELLAALPAEERDGVRPTEFTLDAESRSR